MVDGRIPQDVLDRIAFCCPQRTDEGDAFHRVLRAYEERVDQPGEPIRRTRLASLYCQAIDAEADKLLRPEERRALELCAEGAPYSSSECPSAP
jgi:hypothetical protein